MENSSKALIIAGSILVAILLISVGVIIMNSTGNTQQTVEDMANSTAIRSFNSQLTPYEGTNQSAAQVRSLMSTVNALASSTGKTINVYNGAAGTTSLDASSLASNQKYTVKFEYTNGYISTIRVYQ